MILRFRPAFSRIDKGSRDRVVVVLLAVLLIGVADPWGQQHAGAATCTDFRGTDGRCHDKRIDKFDSWINLFKLDGLAIQSAKAFSFVGDPSSSEGSRYRSEQHFVGYLGRPANHIHVALERTHSSSKRTSGGTSYAASKQRNEAILKNAKRRGAVKSYRKASGFNYGRSSVARYIDSEDRECAQFLALIDDGRIFVRILACIAEESEGRYRALQKYLSRDVRLGTRAQNVAAHQRSNQTTVSSNPFAQAMVEPDRSICRRAISAPAERLAWRTEDGAQPFVVEAKRRTFTLERCAKMLGRAAQLAKAKRQAAGSPASSSEVPLAAVWEGEFEIASGTLSYAPTEGAGSLKFGWPVGDYECAGIWKSGPEGRSNGIWELNCSNGMSAKGNYVMEKAGVGSGEGKDGEGRAIRITFGG